MTMIKYGYVLIFLMCIIICSCDLLKKEIKGEVRGVTVEAVDFNSGSYEYYGAYKFTNNTSLKVIIEAEVWSLSNFPIPIFRKKSCCDKFVIEPHKTYTWDKAKWRHRFQNENQKLKYIAYICEN